MEETKRNKHITDVDLRQVDNEVLDTYKPAGEDYPIIERTENALIWPEEIKGGIDLLDTNNVTQVPLDPDTPLEFDETSKNKKPIK